MKLNFLLSKESNREWIETMTILYFIPCIATWSIWKIISHLSFILLIEIIFQKKQIIIHSLFQHHGLIWNLLFECFVYSFEYSKQMNWLHHQFQQTAAFLNIYFQSEQKKTLWFTCNTHQQSNHINVCNSTSNIKVNYVHYEFILPIKHAVKNDTIKTSNHSRIKQWFRDRINHAMQNHANQNHAMQTNLQIQMQVIQSKFMQSQKINSSIPCQLMQARHATHAIQRKCQKHVNHAIQKICGQKHANHAHPNHAKQKHAIQSQMMMSFNSNISKIMRAKHVSHAVDEHQSDSMQSMPMQNHIAIYSWNQHIPMATQISNFKTKLKLTSKKQQHFQRCNL